MRTKTMWRTLKKLVKENEKKKKIKGVICDNIKYENSF